MNAWHDIEPGSDVPRILNVIVEIPKGSQNKYEYDKKNGLIKLDRVLFSSVHYPVDYGLVPRTLSEDGDPLDVLVLTDTPTYPGILLEARVVGLLEMNDNGEQDNKVLCVVDKDPRFKDVNDLKDVRGHTLKEIAHFFEVYKNLEGKAVKVSGWKDAKAGSEEVMKSIKAYDDKFKGQ